jgi:hypothetical protein
MICWHNKAIRALNELLASMPVGDARGKGGSRRLSRAAVDKLLERTFPNIDAIVVEHVVHGFRPKPGQCVLLVETCDGAGKRSGKHVVKIGPVKSLDKELRGWESCRPHGLEHDPVLMRLCVGHRPADWRRSRTMTLCYGDAQHFVGVETTCTLEDAALQSVEYGVPTLASVGFVLVELHERLGRMLYARSRVEDPRQKVYVLSVRNLTESMRQWDEDPIAMFVRTATDHLVNHGASIFIEPVNYLEFVLECVASKGG